MVSHRTTPLARGQGAKEGIGENSGYLFVVGAEASYVDGRHGAIDRRGARERRDDPPVDGHACVEPRAVEADVSRGDQQQASSLDALTLQRTRILCHA